MCFFLSFALAIVKIYQLNSDPFKYIIIIKNNNDNSNKNIMIAFFLKKLLIYLEEEECVKIIFVKNVHFRWSGAYATRMVNYPVNQNLF